MSCHPVGVVVNASVLVLKPEDAHVSVDAPSMVL
jgi:hypothetical protein